MGDRSDRGSLLPRAQLFCCPGSGGSFWCFGPFCHGLFLCLLVYDICILDLFLFYTLTATKFRETKMVFKFGPRTGKQFREWTRKLTDMLNSLGSRRNYPMALGVEVFFGGFVHRHMCGCPSVYESNIILCEYI